MNESEKQQIYQKWIERGRPWFHIDKSKEPTYYEKQIIMEIQKREQTRKTVPKRVNEIKKFDRLLRDGANY
jgi:hypothetical protein